MPKWSKADRALLAELRSRHSVADIAREAATFVNRNPGRPPRNRVAALVDALDCARAVELKLRDGMPATKAYEQVAAEATARGFKVSARSVRAIYATALRWASAPGDRREALAVLNRFHAKPLAHRARK